MYGFMGAYKINKESVYSYGLPCVQAYCRLRAYDCKLAVQEITSLVFCAAS